MVRQIPVGKHIRKSLEKTFEEKHNFIPNSQLPTYFWQVIDESLELRIKLLHFHMIKV